MKASELRIGNYLMRNEKVFQVVVIDITESSGLTNAEPIPLTEEWLIRLGFEKKSWFLEGVDFEHIYYQLGDIVVYLLKNSFEIELIKQGVQFNLFINFKKEVHILQNIIHALTNTELECTSR